MVLEEVLVEVAVAVDGDSIDEKVCKLSINTCISLDPPTHTMLSVPQEITHVLEKNRPTAFLVYSI